MRWEGLKVDKKLDYLMSEIEGWVTMTNKLSIGVRNLEGSTPSLTAEIADLRKWHWAQPRGCHQCGLSSAGLSALRREPAHDCGPDDRQAARGCRGELAHLHRFNQRRIGAVDESRRSDPICSPATALLLQPRSW
jgi:hypothetical protein